MIGAIVTHVMVLPLFVGCGHTSGELPTYMHPETLYLNATVYDQIYVEVDVVEGASLPKDYIDKLRHILEKYCSKPSRINIVQDDAVRMSDFEGIPIDYVPVLCLDGPGREIGQSAYIHLFLYNGDAGHWKKVRNADIPMTAIEGAQISIDVSYGRNGFEQFILQHEIGHLLGLCRNESHGNGTHCNYHGCLMQSSPTLASQTKWLFGGEPKVELCSECQQDLNSNRSQTPGNLYFEGPFLMRKEGSYAIAMLGGTYLLFIPNQLLADFDWKEVLLETKRTLPNTLKTWKEKGKGSGRIWAVLQSRDSSLPDEAYISAIKDASKTDPSQNVRSYARQELIRMQTKQKG
jgi:hypothetical protein